jgi:hypothetical protein
MIHEDRTKINKKSIKKSIPLLFQQIPGFISLLIFLLILVIWEVHLLNSIFLAFQDIDWT